MAAHSGSVAARDEHIICFPKLGLRLKHLMELHNLFDKEPSAIPQGTIVSCDFAHFAIPMDMHFSSLDVVIQSL